MLDLNDLNLADGATFSVTFKGLITKQFSENNEEIRQWMKQNDIDPIDTSFSSEQGIPGYSMKIKVSRLNEFEKLMNSKWF